MSLGILICGLNGCGKSTLGKALAQELGLYFLDNEYLFFSRNHTDEPYTNPRSKEEANRFFSQEISEHENFVFAAVTGDYASNAENLYQYAILLEAPKEIRMERIVNRSFQKFGERMLPGGDLHRQEDAFFQYVRNRPEDHVEKWVKRLNCPILRVDGTKPIEENIAMIRNRINQDTLASIGRNKC